MNKVPDRLAIAFAATACALWLLGATADPLRGGSAWTPLAVVALLAVHAWLLGGGERTPTRIGPLGAILAACVVAAMGAFTVSAITDSIREAPADPRGDAQLGVAIQSVERLEAGQSPYGAELPMHGWSTESFIAPGLLLPIWTARQWGADARLVTPASIAIVAFLATLALAAVRGNVALGLAAASAAALLAAPGLVEFSGFGIVAPHWPLALLFGVALSQGSWILAGAALGMLAAASPGWVLLIPAGLLLLRRLSGRWSAGAIGFAVLIPVVVYGSLGDRLDDFIEAALSTAFYRADPRNVGEVEPWRHPTLMGLLVVLKMAPALLIWLPAALWVLGRRLAAAPTEREATACFALSAALVMLCGPATFAFHLHGHAWLLLGLLAASHHQPADPPRPKHDSTVVLLALLAAAAVAVPGHLRLSQPHPAALDVTGALRFDEGLRRGWNAIESDQVWSAEPVATIAFHMNEPAPGMLLLSLGVPSGPFTPFNPVKVALNGRALGVWTPFPGEFTVVPVPVRDATAFVRGANLLTLESAWVRTPASLGLGTDNRPLGVNWRGMSWQPATRNTSEAVAP